MMSNPLRTKQVNLRFPLPLLNQIKSKADAKQQAIADWILALVSREFEPEKSPAPLPSDHQTPFIFHPELLEYIKTCLAPLHSQVFELRTQMGESKA